MKNKLEVGQKVWYLPPSYRHNDKRELIEATISKVGRMYFELNEKRYGKFEIETLYIVSQHSNNSRVYLSDSEYYEEKELQHNWREVRDKITSAYRCPYTNEQLKKILEIIS